MRKKDRRRARKSPLFGACRSDIEAELCRRSLYEFTKRAWFIVEPADKYVDNWHIRLICDALQKQIEGDPKYRKILIMVPPGTAKSLLASVLAPAWEWILYPWRRKLVFTNDEPLVTRDNLRVRDLITSDWYQAIATTASYLRGEQPWSLSLDQNQKLYFKNTASGFRQGLSLGTRVTGKRGHGIIVDDPLDAKAVTRDSIEQVRKATNDVWRVLTRTLPSRVNRAETATWTVISQRLHPRDPAGRYLKKSGWYVVNLRMEHEPGHALNHPDDPRTEKGELLFPALFPQSVIDEFKEELQEDYHAQYNQDPRDKVGAIFKRHYWGFWWPVGQRKPDPVVCQDDKGQWVECRQMERPIDFDTQALSWDLAFKGKASSDRVAGGAWGRVGSNCYLLDLVNDTLDFGQSKQAITDMSRAFPEASAKYVEDGANGPGIECELRNKIPGILLIPPRGGKETRANITKPYVRAGNVWLPHPQYCPWVREFIDQCEAFPAVDHDDAVDMMTQYLGQELTGAADYSSMEAPVGDGDVYELY
jgi:predicted phage terminase large subunit-like protein